MRIEGPAAVKRWVAVAVFVLTALTFALPVVLASVGSVVSVVSVMNGAGCDPRAPTAVAIVSVGSSAGFDAETRSIAATAVRIADQRRLPDRAKVVILAAGLQESGSGDVTRPMIRNLDHGDRDSLGWLQQRGGWGSVAERMSPGIAAGKFYDALVKVPHWTQLPVTVAAQRVQISGFPDAYAKWQEAAVRLIADVSGRALIGTDTATEAGGCTDSGSLDGPVTLVAELNPQGAGNWQGAVRAGPFWYVAHATAGDRRQMFHRLDASGRELEQMMAVGFYHATSFGVVGNVVYATDGQGRVVTFGYRPGATIRTGTPTGWHGYISLDPDGTAAVIRNGNRYQAYDLHTKHPRGQLILTPTGPRQGFSISGGVVFVLTGPTNQPARLDSYSVSTGQPVGTRDVTAVGFRAGERHDHREPEGMHGNLMGVKVGTGDRRRLRVYRIDPAGAATSSGRTRTVTSQGRRYVVPIPAGRAGAAVSFALDQLGDRYAWAAHGPDAWDCSGLTGSAWTAAGVSIPSQSDAQNRTLRHVPLSQARPGDIFWHPGHVQLFVGVIDGRRTVVEAANPSVPVRIDDSGWMDIQAVLRPA